MAFLLITGPVKHGPKSSSPPPLHKKEIFITKEARASQAKGKRAKKVQAQEYFELYYSCIHDSQKKECLSMREEVKKTILLP
jgi:hypothetical protein